MSADSGRSVKKTAQGEIAPKNPGSTDSHKPVSVRTMNWVQSGERVYYRRAGMVIIRGERSPEPNSVLCPNRLNETISYRTDIDRCR